MTLTSPACPSAQQLPAEVQFKVKSIPEIQDAKVEIVWEPAWTKERMSEAAKLTLGFGERDHHVSLEVRQLPAGDPFPAALLRTRRDDEGEKGGLRKRVPRLHEGWHQDGEHQLLVRPSVTLVEIEDGDRQNAALVLYFERLKVGWNQPPRVGRRHLEETAQPVVEVIVPSVVGHMPYLCSTLVMIRAPSSSSSREWAAEIDIRKRDRCFGTAGYLTGFR